MKKLFLIVATLFVAVSFSACSDDKDDNKINPDQIVGTWQIISRQEIRNNSPVSGEAWPTENDYYTYTFQNDKTVILKWYDGSDEITRYTYTISGNMLTMKEQSSEPFTEIYEIKELTGSRLVLFSHEEEDGNVYEATETFKKI